MIRAKFTVDSITENRWDKDQKIVKFSAVGAEGIPENQRFHKYTPSGSLEMTVTNPAVLDQLKLGATFYLDFTPADQ